MGDSDEIRVGIIGAGQNTRKMNIPKLMQIPGVKIVEVANRSVQSGKKVADDFSIPVVRSDWKEVATSPDIDAVVIGTWPYLHCPTTCLALQSGKHVLSEARMAMNYDEARTMLQCSKDHPHLIAQLVPAPFTFGVDKTIKSLISNLGELRYFSMDYQSASLAASGNEIHWRRNRQYSGQNCMVLGILYESMLRWLPKAQWVNATAKIFNGKGIDPDTGKTENIEIPDYLTLQMQLTNGMAGTMTISEVAHHAGTPMVKIFGDRGTLQFEFKLDGKLWFGKNNEDRLTEIEIAPEDQAHWRVEEEFINAIRGKEEVKLTPFETGAEYMKFTSAVWQSHQNNGARVEI
jgi:predicted dehydrogenase